MAKKSYSFIPITPMKDKYTPDEWQQREQEYMNSVNSINIPFEPDDVDLTNINAMIDQVYSIAKIETAIYTRLYEKFYRRRKNSETEVYVIVKRNIPKDAHGNPQKKTEAEIKALGIEYLTTAKVDQTNYNIYQMLEMAEDRRVFMDAVIDILKQKSDKLITDSGALKMAIQLSGNYGNNQRYGN